MTLFRKVNETTRSRWLLLSLTIASLGPGLLVWLDGFLDDRNMLYDGNELTALGLIFSPLPFVLLLLALRTFRKSPARAALMIVILIVSLCITFIPVWREAYAGGLRPSSKADVEYLEWRKIAIWTGMIFTCCLAAILLDALTSLLFKCSTRDRKRPLDPTRLEP